MRSALRTLTSSSRPSSTTSRTKTPRSNCSFSPRLSSSSSRAPATRRSLCRRCCSWLRRSRTIPTSATVATFTGASSPRTLPRQRRSCSRRSRSLQMRRTCSRGRSWTSSLGRSPPWPPSTTSPRPPLSRERLPAAARHSSARQLQRATTRTSPRRAPPRPPPPSSPSDSAVLVALLPAVRIPAPPHSAAPTTFLILTLWALVRPPPRPSSSISSSSSRSVDMAATACPRRRPHPCSRWTRSTSSATFPLSLPSAVRRLLRRDSALVSVPRPARSVASLVELPPAALLICLGSAVPWPRQTPTCPPRRCGCLPQRARDWRLREHFRVARGSCTWI
eukprot:Opistho-2@13441